jgi:glycosyltransferase involved in cell wall biosynthesis
MASRRGTPLKSLDESSRPTVAIVTCYFDPEYVRGSVIRAAVERDPSWDTVSLVNRRRGIARYPEVLFKLLALKVRVRPDLIILTFRGQEILPLVLSIAGKTPVVFDEFIVPIAYATGESHRRTMAIRIKHGLARLTARRYPGWLSRCAAVLADTRPHALLSAESSGLPASKYQVVPVGADESIFSPAEGSRLEHHADVFRVLYYGNMLPLHGLGTLLAAAELLSDDPAITFLLVGGGKPTATLSAESVSRGARIDYVPWIDYHLLPEAIANADLCLGGPFGGTPQALRVVTGKTFQFLATGAPTLIGRSQASSDFTDGLDCLIVDQDDPVALAAKIRGASRHRDLLPAIGAGGRALFETRYSTAAIAQTLNSRLHAILDRAGGHHAVPAASLSSRKNSRTS